MKVISFVLLISIIFSLNLREKNIEKTIDRFEKNKIKNQEIKDNKKKLSRPPKMKKESLQGFPGNEIEKNKKKEKPKKSPNFEIKQNMPLRQPRINRKEKG